MSLTPREAEVAHLLTRGMAYKKIAREMGISTHTTKAHVQNAAAKIEGPGSPRHRLLMWALTEGKESARR
jgi:DNA-binding CsgD family transcriptional regulator